MIHFESGGCNAGVTQSQIETWTISYDINHQYTSDSQDCLEFRCPTCNHKMSKVSAMFQHVESLACEASSKGILTELRRHLESRIEEL